MENGWRQKDGNYCDDWRTLAGAYNSVLRTGKNAKYGKVQPKKEETVVERKRLLPNYICYTDAAAITIPPIRQVVLRILL